MVNEYEELEQNEELELDNIDEMLGQTGGEKTESADGSGAEENSVQEEESGFSMEELENLDELPAKDQKKISEMNKSLADKILEMQRAGRESKKLTKASKEEKRDIYVDEHIIPIDDRPGFETEGERVRKQYQELYDAWRAKRMVRGVISFVTTEEYGNSQMIVANVTMGSYKIMIPLPYLTTLKERMVGTKEEQFKLANLLANERIGSEIDFYIDQIDEKNMVATGNRVRALRDQKQAHFLKKRRNKYLLNTGDIVEARVCYVTKAHICVESHGVEIVLTEKDVAYRRLRDIREIYKTGDRLKIKLKEVKRIPAEDPETGKKGVILKVEASIKEAYRDPREVYFKQLKENATCQGIVTQVNEIGVFVKLHNMDYDVLCSPPKDFATPPEGSTVIIGIYKKNEENFTCTGYIKRQLF